MSDDITRRFCWCGFSGCATRKLSCVNSRLWISNCEALGTKVCYARLQELYWQIVRQNCSLLGCYVACSGSFLPTFRDSLRVPSSKPYRFWLRNNQEARSYGVWFVNTIPVIWRGAPICWPETSVRNYDHSLRNNPEERISHVLRGGSLRSRTNQTPYSVKSVRVESHCGISSRRLWRYRECNCVVCVWVWMWVYVMLNVTAVNVQKRL